MKEDAVNLTIMNLRAAERFTISGLAVFLEITTGTEFITPKNFNV
jgi:hypothetical protein